MPLNTIEKRKTQLIEKLKNKEYRDSFVSSNIDVGIAFQIRALRKLEGYSQDKLAEIAEMKQERISALENPSNSPNISTLVKIAAALNVALMVRFVSFGDLVKWDLNLSAKSLEVPSFKKDPYFKEINEEAVITADRETLPELSTEEVSEKTSYPDSYRKWGVPSHQGAPLSLASLG